MANNYYNVLQKSLYQTLIQLFLREETYADVHTLIQSIPDFHSVIKKKSTAIYTDI